MAQIRKTRQQKIQQSQRRIVPMTSSDSEVVKINAAEQSVATASPNQEIADTQLYVMAELKRIGWISLLCAAILAIATIFLADFEWAKSVRDLLPF